MSKKSTNGSERPRVGIISKREHATSMMKRLIEAGADVHLLGSNKNVRISPRLPTIVIRTASCSHGASEVATKWWREDKDNRHLLFSNSAEQSVVELGRMGILSPDNPVVAKALRLEVPEAPRAPERRRVESPPKKRQASTKARVEIAITAIGEGHNTKAALWKIPGLDHLTPGSLGAILAQAMKTGRLARLSKLGQPAFYVLADDPRVPEPEAEAETQQELEPVEEAPEPVKEAPAPPPAAPAPCLPVESPQEAAERTQATEEIQATVHDLVEWLNRWQVRDLIIEQSGNVALSNTPTAKSPPTIKFTIC